MGNSDQQPGANEVEQVAAVWESTLVAGTSWHVLSQKWWDSWCAYTGFSPDAGSATKPSTASRPGSIDNSNLLDPEYTAEHGILRKDIMEGADYTLVDGRTGDLLFEWYGGGPILARSVITYGARKKTRVDLHPAYLTLIECEPATGSADESTRVVKVFTAKTNFSDIQELRHNQAIEDAKKSDSRPPMMMMPGAHEEEARTNEADGLDGGVS